MTPFIAPPRRLPLLLRPFIWFAEKIVGKSLLPARLLAWYPRAAVGSGALEALVAHGGPERDGRNVSPRLLKLVRVRASLTIACPYCVDMNSFEHEAAEVTAAELEALRDGDLSSFEPREQTAIQYAMCISETPLQFPAELVDRVRHHFSERQMVILATTAAQVGYWGRLIQALGIPPAGFGGACQLPGSMKL